MDVTATKQSKQALEKVLHEMHALKEHFRLAVDTIPGLVWSALPDGSVDFVNQRWREYTGLTLEEASGWEWQGAIHPEDLPGLVDYWREVSASRKPGEREARLQRFDGEYRWFLFRALPLYDELGNLVKWYGTTTDIHDRKWAEALLAGEKRLLEMVAKGNPLSVVLDALCRLVEEATGGYLCSILLVEPNGSRLSHGAAPSLPRNYTEENDGSAIALGEGPCALAAFLREPVIASDFASDQRWPQEYRARALAHGLRACWSTPMLSQGGAVLGTFALYYREPGSPSPQQQYIVEQFTDLASIAVERAQTEDTLRQSEAELRESESRFALAVAGANDGIWDRDLVNDRTFYSPRAQELLGLPSDGVNVRPYAEWGQRFRFHPDDVAQRAAAIRNHLEGRTPHFEGEWRVLHPDGGYRWIYTRGLCTRDATGRVLRFAGSITDIDARKRTEEALRISEERYALAMEATQDGHWDWIVGTGEYYVSPRDLQLYGLPADTTFASRGDFLARLPLAPEDRDAWLRAVADLFAGTGSRLRMELRANVHGETRWIQFNGVCVRDASGKPVRWSGTSRDVTERKLAEIALRRSEERYALAVDAAGDGHTDWIVATDEFYASPRFLEMCGLAAETTFKGRLDFVNRFPFHPDDRDEAVQAMTAHFAGKPVRLEMEMGMVVRGETRWVRLTGLCSRDASGALVRWNGALTDVTERRHAQELERQLRHAQRLEAMGTLAGGIAHDFNNILGAILGFAEMALRDAPQGSRLRRDVDSIMTAGERGRALVDRILAFSRSGVGDRVAVHVEEVVREALNLLAAKLPKGITIEARLSAGRAAMLGDATQAHQVLMNLATNAVQAMTSGGTLRVSLDAVCLDTPHVATTATIAGGEYVVLQVADCGIGIPKEIIEQIFDPFFTTKEVGVGTGLGLSLVHGIVTEVGGAIDVTSTVGAGSVFTVYLPRVGDAADDLEREQLDLPRGDRQQILVVDDEEPLVRLATEILRDLGYVPVGFTSSAAALQAFRADPKRFDAVITDERMPGMSGSKLIRELRVIRSAIPILLVSGYLGAAVAQRARDAGADEVLKKPLSTRDLATSLARLLLS
jgi:PAS domain S-box-containing protein